MYLKLRVGALARDRNISERELWDRTERKVARNTVRALMRGTNTRVDLETIEKIAAALGVRPMELFEETEEKPRGPMEPALAPA